MMMVVLFKQTKAGRKRPRILVDVIGLELNGFRYFNNAGDPVQRT